jgi:galactose mutarotase-like enzyme
MFRLDHTGAVAEWDDNLGNHVLYPARQVGSMTRGRLFVCAPLFGNVPNTEAWRGVNLPKHGLIRELTRAHPITHEGGQTRRRGTLTDDFTIPFADERYPWVMSVDSHIVRKEDAQELVYETNIRRSMRCQNRKPMPCSLGLHPYFATHGAPWRILYQGKVAADAMSSLSEASYLDVDAGVITLETSLASITVDPSIGYDRVYIWSDRPSEYICIEPTVGKRRAYALDRGQLLTGTCVFSYKAKGR